MGIVADDFKIKTYALSDLQWKVVDHVANLLKRVVPDLNINEISVLVLFFDGEMIELTANKTANN